MGNGCICYKNITIQEIKNVTFIDIKNERAQTSNLYDMVKYWKKKILKMRKKN